MKKTLILASLFALTITGVQAADFMTLPAKEPVRIEKPKAPSMDAKKENFDKRLNLSEKQKKQAEEIRLKSREEMKPIMEQIKTKHEQGNAIVKKELTDDEKAQLEQLRTEIKDLHKQAHEIRMKNMKEFEQILTKKQKAELEKMKQEGRKDFARHHKFGPRPDFGHRPVMPPVKK